ncbi:MAG: chitobiase/beta-hexosaminidase C-terminal domain-containing protein [Clostridiales bacterium]|jgi:hypothetical protein|nr:chitobiase/beta-hexosaminidase C-terminal domain-containing protein [Clostridiales bacterium]
MRIKRFTAVLLSACLAIMSPLIGAAAERPQGNGTDVSPYVIQTRAELIDLAFRKYDSDLSKTYILAADINLSGTAWTPIGDEAIPFKGVFDGNGHSITGLSVSAGSSVTGLFGYNSGVIKGLMVSGTVRGNENTGILAGFNSGEIYQCWASGSVSGTGYSVGSLVGQSSGIITECGVGNASVESTNAYVGGLIGLNSAGKVEYCYSLANVSISGSGSIAGGLIGVLSGGSVRYSYAAGRMTPVSVNVSGLIGRIDSAASTDSVYYDSDAAGRGDAVGIALSTSQAKTVAAYPGWDFNNIWDIYRSVNNGYPYLRNNPFLFETPVGDSKASVPVANPAAGSVAYGTKVTLSSSTDGAVIYYTTNGRTPTVSSTRYTQPITVTENVNIRAITVAHGYENSDMIEYVYKIVSNPKAGAPVSNVASGTVSYGTIVTLSSDIRGAVIYYTTDGRNPTTSSRRYTEPITVTADVTVKAITVAPDYSDSDVAEFVYKVRLSAKTGAPYSNTASGIVSWGSVITLSSTTAGAQIFYTTNGNKPTTSSTLYTGPITITQNTTIKAFAVSKNLADSDMSTLVYTLSQGDLTPYSMTITLQIGNKAYTRNGEIMYFDVAPYIEPSSNRTMVPIRFIAEALGATVSWDNATSTDYISLYDKTLSIVLNKQLPGGMGSAMLINDRLFVPIRYVSEQLGATVDWDQNTRTVFITK